MKITHSAEPHEPRDARRSSIEPIERVLPFCCNLISQGLGGHCTAPTVDGRATTNLTPFGNCRNTCTLYINRPWIFPHRKTNRNQNGPITRGHTRQGRMLRYLV